MLRVAVMPSAMRSVGYRRGLLEVEMESGDVYRYLDEPRDLFTALLRAESKGAFFSDRIRDGYRVEGPL